MYTLLYLFIINLFLAVLGRRYYTQAFSSCRQQGLLSSCSPFVPASHCLVAQRLKRLAPMRETWARPLGREDPLEKEMVTYSSILA